LITNDASQPYRGTLYDAIMVNSYKALGFLALGEPANARVELNRARDRQRRAVDAFSEQIRAEQRTSAESRSETPEADMGATLSRAHDALDEEYEQLSRWSVYPDYVNPLATWLEGLFLMTRAEAPGILSVRHRLWNEWLVWYRVIPGSGRITNGPRILPPGAVVTPSCRPQSGCSMKRGWVQSGWSGGFRFLLHFATREPRPSIPVLPTRCYAIVWGLIAIAA